MKGTLRVFRAGESGSLLPRVLTSLALSPLILWSLYGPAHFGGPEAMLLMAAFFVWFGMREYYALSAKSSLRVRPVIPAMWGVLTAASGYLYLQGWMSPLGVVTVITLFAAVTCFRRLGQAPSGGLAEVAVTWFGYCYVALPFTLLFFLRKLPQGSSLILGLLLVTIFNDVGAYLVGSRWGRHKLCPTLSPHKTVEGALGGIAAALVVGLGAALVWRLVAPAGFAQFLPSSSHRFFRVIEISIVLGIVGQLGDLVESLLKRDAGLKDSGTLLPGHGGVLDVVDALLFNIPAFQLLLVLFR